MDTGAEPLAPFARARPGSHQGARRLLRAVSRAGELCVRRLASHRTRGSGALGGLVNDAQGPGAAAALLTVREESCGGRGGCQAEAAWHPEESALSTFAAKHRCTLVRRP